MITHFPEKPRGKKTKTKNKNKKAKVSKFCRTITWNKEREAQGMRV